MCTTYKRVFLNSPIVLVCSDSLDIPFSLQNIFFAPVISENETCVNSLENFFFNHNLKKLL